MKEQTTVVNPHNRIMHPDVRALLDLEAEVDDGASEDMEQDGEDELGEHSIIRFIGPRA